MSNGWKMIWNATTKAIENSSRPRDNSWPINNRRINLFMNTNEQHETTPSNEQPTSFNIQDERWSEKPKRRLEWIIYTTSPERTRFADDAIPERERTRSTTSRRSTTRWTRYTSIERIISLQYPFIGMCVSLYFGYEHEWDPCVTRGQIYDPGKSFWIHGRIHLSSEPGWMLQKELMNPKRI